MRQWTTLTATSPTTFTLDVSSMSYVSEMLPSMEFSTGTTPESMAPTSVRLKTSRMLLVGTVSTDGPK